MSDPRIIEHGLGRVEADPFAAWRAALVGNFDLLERGRAPCGFYRHRNRAGEFEPVAVWHDEDCTPWAKVGTRPPVCLDGGEEAFCERVIAWCFRSPITEDLYFAVADGAPWPEAPPERPTAFSNLPADAFEALRVEVEGERQEIDRWLAADPITDQVACDRAANWAGRLAELEKRVGAERTAEKRPHDEAVRAIQGKWKPLEDEAGVLKRRLKDAQLPFQRAQRQREAEARAAAATAGKAIRPARPAGAGTTGRRTSLRTTMAAQIEDIDAALLALRDHAEVRDLVQRIANRVARAGGTHPGCRNIPTESVA